MQTQQENDTFQFTYSAKEQEELKKIRQKYEPQGETKMEKLRRLDAGVTRKATRAALSIGTVGALVMGTGMSLTMTDIGASLGLVGNMDLVCGIVIGVLGMGLVGAAYPIYVRVTKKEREKIAPEILQLTEELLK